MWLKTLLSLIFVVCAFAHPTKYPHLRANANCSAPPEILSFHIHIVYIVTDAGAVQRALQLRDQARAHFADLIGPDCEGLYDEGRLCFITDHDFTQFAGGPWPSGEWAMFVPVSYYAQTVPWFTQHYGEFSLFVHPNSGCEWEDHATWGLWGGEPWLLNTGIFKQGQQTNEFSAERGDSGNPVCLPANSVCGHSDGDGPEGVCCLGLQCQCPTNQCYCLKSNQNVLVQN
eukprot:TRINITY_DN24_c0_g1_i4.p1 TRINITY_DN24_c0_g1~~TRINITY_DN24_c0_g1_i4.p1  ORF type:complete len:229 (-),score=39.81 TRINITY_DN24_c0_g1_i4:201-887(-)